jgi:hypothetical protein
MNSGNAAWLPIADDIHRSIEILEIAAQEGLDPKEITDEEISFLQYIVRFEFKGLSDPETAKEFGALLKKSPRKIMRFIEALVEANARRERNVVRKVLCQLSWPVETPCSTQYCDDLKPIPLKVLKRSDRERVFRHCGNRTVYCEAASLESMVRRGVQLYIMPVQLSPSSLQWCVDTFGPMKKKDLADLCRKRRESLHRQFKKKFEAMDRLLRKNRNSEP